MVKKTSHLILSAFYLFLLILIGLGCGIPTLTELLPKQRTGPAPTPFVPPREVSSDYQARLLWHKDGIYMVHHTYPSPGLLVNKDQLAFINYLGGTLSEVNQLTVLDSLTGAVLWQSERFGPLEDVTVKEGNAVVLQDRGTSLDVYNISGDEHPILTSNYSNEYIKFYMTPIPDSGLIYIYYDDPHGDQLIIQTIDITGTKVGSPHKLQSPIKLFAPFVISGSFVLLTGQEYVALDLETGELLWSVLSEGGIDSWPILLGNSLIVAPGNGKRYRLLSLDIENGHELWRTKEEFSSAMTSCEGNLFALRNDATLVRLDPITGVVEEEIAFSPASLDAGASAFWLACDEQRVFIYFGDSQELFALDL